MGDLPGRAGGDRGAPRNRPLRARKELAERGAPEPDAALDDRRTEDRHGGGERDDDPSGDDHRGPDDDESADDDRRDHHGHDDHLAASLTLRIEALQDTWISVKQSSSSGTLLYEGTLAAGAGKTFTGTVFWVRFGAASNVLATLNGRALALPGGTYSVPITSAGLGARSG